MSLICIKRTTMWLFKSLLICCLSSVVLCDTTHNLYQEGWYKSLRVLDYNSTIYFVSKELPATYFEAMQMCNMMGMRLVTITSEEQNTRLNKYIRDINVGNEFWTSASRFIEAHTWIWFSTGKEIEYSNWQAGHPIGGANHCLLVRRNQKDLFWFAHNCFARMNFICEKVNN